MTKRLSRSGNSLALVIDRPLLEALDIDADTELELSTDGDVLVVTPIRDRKRSKHVGELVAEAHEQYGGVFRRLSERASRFFLRSTRFSRSTRIRFDSMAALREYETCHC